MEPVHPAPGRGEPVHPAAMKVAPERQEPKRWKLKSGRWDGYLCLQLLNRCPCDAMDSVEMESVPIKEELFELELVPFSVEFFGLACPPIKQELCEVQCDSSQQDVAEIKAEHNELEIPQTEELLFVKQEVLEIKQECLTVEFDHMEPGKEESEDFKPNIPELEPIRLRKCSVVLERICMREQGTGEEGSPPNSTQGAGKEDGWSYSEYSLAGE
ncbi:UNVERIFIED_CONTAM: hypothetical protein FKN15_011785 [Acipenser sinensis]